MFRVVIVEGAKAEIRRLKSPKRALVLDAIRKHLTEKPNVEEGNKKILRGLKPPWSQVRPVWQLTVVPFRIFYDVDDEHQEVVVNAVREKRSGRTTKEIL